MTAVGRRNAWGWVWNGAIAALGGALVYLLVEIATRVPPGVSPGFPFVYTTPVTPCSSPNTFDGCGYSFHLGPALADYAIWVAILFVGTLAVRRLLTLTRSSPGPRRSDAR